MKCDLNNFNGNKCITHLKHQAIQLSVIVSHGLYFYCIKTSKWKMCELFMLFIR